MLCSTGGVQEGYRRIDHVIGIVAEVCVHGKVVKTVADAPFMLKKHKEGIRGIKK